MDSLEMSPEGGRDRSASVEENKFQSDGSVADSTKEEFSAMLLKLADSSDEDEEIVKQAEEQADEEEQGAAKTKGEKRRIQPDRVEAVEGETRVQRKGEQLEIHSRSTSGSRRTSLGLSEAMENTSKQGSSSEMNASEAAREYEEAQLRISKRRERSTTFRQWGLNKAQDMLEEQEEQGNKLFNTLGREAESMERQAEDADRESNNS